MSCVKGETMEVEPIEVRELDGYEFKIFDDDWGYLVEIWKDGSMLKSEFATCKSVNCVLSDYDLINLI